MSSDAVILLVEDNQNEIDLMLRAFSKSKISSEIVVARDGQEAVDHLLSTDLMPDLILLDLMLPKLDGFEVLRRLRADAKKRHVPVVVFSSSNDDKDLRLSYELGASSVVRKPVDFTELVEASRLLGQYWLKLNRSVKRIES